MKKYAILIFFVIMCVAGISYIYLNYKANYNNTKKDNYQFESYYEKDIPGTELATLINKAVDNNTINDVQKDEKGRYINNNNNSIQIDIYFLDDEKTHPMEEFYTSGIQQFMTYYSEIKFKCTGIEHHQNTNKVSYMLFEQVTQ